AMPRLRYRLIDRRIDRRARANSNAIHLKIRLVGERGCLTRVGLRVSKDLGWSCCAIDSHHRVSILYAVGHQQDDMAGSISLWRCAKDRRTKLQAFPYCGARSWL